MNRTDYLWTCILILSLALLPERASAQDLSTLPKIELLIPPMSATSMEISSGDTETTIWVDEHRGSPTSHLIPANQSYSLTISSTTNEATIYGELVSLMMMGQKVYEMKVDSMKTLEEISAISCGLIDLELAGCDNLLRLNLLQNGLTSLSLAETPALQELSLGYNAIRELDCSKCPNLTKLVCSKNDLSSLNISGCSKLIELNVQMNKKLTTLDLSSCKSLVGLTCASTGLAEIDVSGCEDLIFLDSSFAPVKRLKARGCKSLQTLSCYQNDLYNLDLKGCESLDKLSLQHNPNLGLLDISSASNLVTLLCSDCGLREIQIGEKPLLKEFYSFDNKLTTLDFQGAPNLKELQSDNNQLQSLLLAPDMPQLELVSIIKNELSPCAIDSLFVALPQKDRCGQIRIASNPGASTSKSFLAEGKNWTVDVIGNGLGCSINIAVEEVLPADQLFEVNERGITLLAKSLSRDLELYSITGELLYRFVAESSLPSFLSLPSGCYLIRAGEYSQQFIIP